MKPCVSCIYFTYCMQYVWKSSLWIGIYFKELHNEQGYYWPTIYRAWAAVVSTITSVIYKISKIVRALWLAERSVCVRVCKHGCGVMFCFSRANHASTNLKKFSSSKLDKFTLFTHSFVGWNLENRYKESVSSFFRLSWHFKWEKSVFWKASSCKTRTDYACKTSWTRVCDW